MTLLFNSSMIALIEHAEVPDCSFVCFPASCGMRYLLFQTCFGIFGYKCRKEGGLRNLPLSFSNHPLSGARSAESSKKGGGLRNLPPRPTPYPPGHRGQTQPTGLRNGGRFGDCAQFLKPPPFCPILSERFKKGEAAGGIVRQVLAGSTLCQAPDKKKQVLVCSKLDRVELRSPHIKS